VPSDETVQKVLSLPGCKGIYYLAGDEGKSLSITLWDAKDSLLASQEPANAIRSATSTEQNLAIVGVEEFEVLTEQLKD
jgi:hypothetical protein